MNLRRQHPRVFSEGEYLELKTGGPRSQHICAFARRLEDREVLVAVTRWFASLAGDSDRMPLGSPVWDDTWIEAPDSAHPRSYRNILTGETVQMRKHVDGTGFSAAAVCQCCPVALLVND